MEKGELDAALADEIRARTFGDGFMKIVQTVRRNGKTFRISMRPVAIGGETRYQAEMVDDGAVRVKNFDADGAAAGLEEIISQKGVRDLHLMTSSGDLHVRVTRKGRVTATRSAEMARPAKVMPHDRVKKTPLTSFDSAALLRATGLAEGRILQLIGETHLDRDDDLVPLHHARVQYAVDGTPYEARAAISLYAVRRFGRKRFIGRTVPVYYDPSDPAHAYTDRIDRHFFDHQAAEAETVSTSGEDASSSAGG